MSETAATAAVATAAATTTPTWTMSSGSSIFFPSSESEKLTNEQDYYVWSVKMAKAFATVGLLNIVNGTTSRPAEDDKGELALWEMKDTAATALLFNLAESRDRTQSDWFWFDYSMVPRTGPTFQPWRGPCFSHHQLHHRAKSPCESRLSYSGTHRRRHPLIHSPRRSL
ncbi:hypothetical protein NLI96_g12582 [Meripilus lineatus]|uniref:Uncharacterized protein n=1 Tax=Meripilus lineatus TaxID=2056292 RepID=A0AAD5UQZ2_9APHY|nr:hypothetical protein NLI96_g12582 [Physisporinus lineatus]